MKFVRRAAVLATLLALVASAAAQAPARPGGPSSSAARPAARSSALKPPAAAATPTKSAAADDRLDAIAAMVNDEAVLASDVEEQLYIFLQQSGAQPGPAELDTLRRQVLDALIDERLMQAEARKQNVAVTDAEVARAVEQSIVDVRERLGGDAAFQERLRREGMTEAQLRERHRTDMQKQLMIDKLRQKVAPRRPVPQAEAEAYFNSHKDKFPKVPGEVRLSVILIPPQPDSVAMAAGGVKAAALRKRIAAGEKFAKVAQEASEDPASAKSGGDLGFFGRGQMEPAVEEAAFSLKLNELSAPVRSSYGWHLVQALERDTLKTTAGRDSLDEQGRPAIEVHARHILVRVAPTEADIERARTLAERVREQAKKGTDFGTLVRRYSHYSGKASPEGDVGFVSLGTLQPQIRAGLDTLEVGQVSDVLPNGAGFNVFRVTDRHPERDYAVEEIRQQLPEAVSQAQAREKYDAWLKGLRTKAQIEYRNP